jgi:plastocyanin
MSVTKRIRYGAIALIALTLITGCGRKSQLPGQTGTPFVTTTTAPTTTTTVPNVPLNPPTTVLGTGPEVVMGQAPAADTITITAGVFSPATLTVHVGDPVTFVGGDATAYNVSVGSLDPQTVTPNLVETYEFRKPGTVKVTQDFNSDSATITVLPALPSTGPTTSTTFPELPTTPATTTTTAAK